MRCPKCGVERSSVVDSRGDGDSIRRRRECQDCGYRYTTFERIEISLPMVLKKDSRREQFQRDKVRAGLLRACEKRPISMDVIDSTVELVERKVQELCVKEIPSIQIGDFVVEELKKLDKIAYVRFASVYREFSDLRQFADTLEGLDDNPEAEAPDGSSSKKSVNTGPNGGAVKSS